ncbi:unnamed protein product, partial [Rotaria magnacalcarata]
MYRRKNLRDCNISLSVAMYDLRLALLDVENNQTLIRALCGLLMLLPGKTDAFHVLRRRLECVPNFIDKFTSLDKRVA